MNQKNSMGLNSCFMDLDDPFELFRIWMDEAKKKETGDPTAMSLGTANSKGEPSVRMVLLKRVSSKGFVFYTNLNSPKSRDLKENPIAEMCFHWKGINRQIRIFGNVTQIEDNKADLYFSTRPYESRIGAWASDQSSVMKDRSQLLKKIKDFKKKYNNEKNVPRPPYWSGWCLNPSSLEFWLHAENRSHERLAYNKIKSEWKKEILYP